MEILLLQNANGGAFFGGTDLERQLHDRGIKTIVLGGIVTNFGVESTARAASGFGFVVVFAEDVITSINEETHRFAIETIFPKLGRVRTIDQIRTSFAL